MNLQRITDNALADLAANIADLLTGTELSAIDPAVRAELVAELGTLPAELAGLAAEAEVKDGEKKAVFSIKGETRAELADLVRKVRDTLKAGRAPKQQFDLCGLDYPNLRSGSYKPADPTNLSVVGYSNGVNKGQFDGNNRSGVVVYEIWRRVAGNGNWMPHITTKKQTFTDTPVVPGKAYEYRVRAVATRHVSAISNEALVYGVI